MLSFGWHQPATRVSHKHTLAPDLGLDNGSSNKSSRHMKENNNYVGWGRWRKRRRGGGRGKGRREGSAFSANASVHRPFFKSHVTLRVEVRGQHSQWMLQFIHHSWIIRYITSLADGSAFSVNVSVHRPFLKSHGTLRVEGSAFLVNASVHRPFFKSLGILRVGPHSQWMLQFIDLSEITRHMTSRKAKAI